MTGWDFLSGLATIIWSVSWTNVLVFSGFTYLVFLLWRMHVSKTSKFDVDDLFVDHRDNRADRNGFIQIVMAGLSVWLVVTLANNGQPVETLMLGILAIFVTGKTITSVWGQAPQDTTSTIVTTPGGVVSASATATTPVPPEKVPTENVPVK